MLRSADALMTRARFALAVLKVDGFDADSFHALHEPNGGERAPADLVRDVGRQREFQVKLILRVSTKRGEAAT